MIVQICRERYGLIRGSRTAAAMRDENGAEADNKIEYIVCIRTSSYYQSL